MDPNFPFGRKLEQGESSHINENANESDARIRFRRCRLEEEAERVGLNNRFNGRLVHWSLPPHPSNNIRPTRVQPERQMSDDNSAPAPPSHLDAWLARHRAKSRDDLPVHVMTGFHGTVVGNRIRRMQKTETSPTVGVDPREDHRNYPQLNYDLSFFDQRGRRRFVTPKEQYITFENSAGPYGNQAVAVRTEVDLSAFYKCRFVGYQDTLYTYKNRQFFRECEIFGTVDFIFGNAAVIFQNCIIFAFKPRDSQKNTITAQKRELPKEKTGIVVQNCTITAAPGLAPQLSKFQTFLGRPWGLFSRTVVMHSFLDDLIDPMGWLAWEGRSTDKIDEVFDAEYENKGPGADTKGRVPWARKINNSSEAAMFTVKNFINGDQWIPWPIPFDLM